MIINIKEYRIVWSDKNTKYGAIDIRDHQGNTARLRSDDPNLLSFWTNLLRYEKPLYFNTVSEVLYTGTEPLGEEES
ncbi:hypothetical protein [Seonamhaeicola marinus]|uniref:Uncharacterized protein n=1 Tax=Seonamhaeicola marinus TaxID=1912246 RepID=A0A5D0HJV0_9FLAO|nr:hypothetical protein [Seonamhaeicola marinus]TYA71663.1 hypothetical protein FUA24_19050 [Seonamhaeicola marinus]